MNRTVSGCAIMLLVERVTGIATQSYATDAALLDELRGSWPPAGYEPDDRGGYRALDPTGLEAVGAVRLTDHLAIGLAAIDGGAFASLPIARDGDRWRRARPGDGLSAFAAGVPMASERAVGVDQTHESVVVGERAIVKWFRTVGPGPSRAATLIAHLADVGFEGIPAPLGSLTWRSPGGEELALAQGDALLADARDGWDWCVERAAAGDTGFAAKLGALVASLHRSFATRSSVLPQPVAPAEPDAVAAWRDDAQATLEDAVELTDEFDLRSWAPAMRDALEALASPERIEVQPVHGDLHVGQVLEWSGGLAVIDFDGNPTLAEERNTLCQPRERDVAQMVSSLDHVGRVVEARDGTDASAWIAGARSAFLDAAGQVDADLLAAFEVEQECRELVYAARFLPRWRYAPMATLRARFGGNA
jgi:maltokinase